MDKPNILMASPEAVPYVKTGGLADVTGALPDALADLQAKVKVIIPLYRAIDKDKFKIIPHPQIAGEIEIKLGKNSYKLQINISDSGDLNPGFIFARCDELFGRDGIYLDPETGKDYPDNDERYAFFGKAVMEIARALGFKPDIIHMHDWQAAMISGYLSTLYRYDSFFSNTRTVFTIHNIGYQGHFKKTTFPKLGLPDGMFVYGSPFEYWDHVNYLKIGLTTADIITTVSETYAREIRSGNEMGFGMEGILTDRKADLFGVLNGVDYNDWSPEKDSLIPHNYSIDDIDGKAKNKQTLLRLAGLDNDMGKRPLIGVISRLADQKGFDLIEKITDNLFEHDLQFILLGTGDEKYHKLFKSLEQKYPRKMKAFLKFDNRIAHMIEAGADMFLMPSRYEPCGLNQMYSLKYGAVPIVRETGGLADTIVDYTANPKTGNGFSFKEYKPAKLYDAIMRALQTYRDPKIWQKIIQRGMSADHSWSASATRYIEIYQRALAK